MNDEPGDALCTCILNDHPHFEGHLAQEHRDERCTGTWQMEPPCGGCINCLVAQAYHYQRLEGSS